MPKVVRRIPSPVFSTVALSAARAFGEGGEGYDFAIGGLPFNGLPSLQRPITRQTADARKDQTDTSREPGEHSLAFWWLRSQSSFHGGAGQKFLGATDTDQSDLSAYRYQNSTGLDVFTEAGAVRLLPSTQKVMSTAGATALLAATDQGYLYVANGGALTRRYMTPATGQPDLPSASMDFHVDVVPWGGATPILSLTTDGASYFAATATGIWKGTGLGAATKIYTYGPNAVPVLRYVKQRLMLALSGTATPAVYELDPAAAANTALPTSVFNATPNWRWSAIVESPNSILISGDNGARSMVYKTTIDSSQEVPILTAGTVAVEFPPGELVTGMATYLGSVIGVQTTAGFRAGVLANTGDFQYGPLLFTHQRDYPSSAVFGQGNSLYAGYRNSDGVAGLARVDLSDVVSSGQSSLRFPYAPDLRALDGATYSQGYTADATLWDYDRKVFAVAGVGVFVQMHTAESSGVLTTSRIRWDTLEPKLVRFGRVRGEGPGRVTLEVSRDSDTSFYPVGSIDLSRQSDSGDIFLQLEPGQVFTARLTLTGGATLSGYQLKALPVQRPQRIISLPLACFDRETGNNGQIVGGEGSAMMRLRALEEMERSGGVVALQWLSVLPDQELVEYVIVEQVQFEQTAPSRGSQGWGGVITLTMRTVD